ncbi:TnsD family transposase [Robertmurraya sp. DFI.2.37]|uniref:TnsD family Tn7-like transposition protein n=1 Tax=Robertmurraya sp. DFI.2.37 TaxID=3031819 RepID=UPI0012453EB8|nr:TnsD family Tn7-like transposition protein [Robertmurraya sp. DFI.2.37]MDF1511262.1 TnsD family transposase [Robertmurraya sp. DFI.2.37]
MILQFVTPYPSEILYSVLGRYHIRSGNIFWKHTLEDLFGKRTISASIYLPSGIHSLVERLPENTTITERMLIENHTMFPFYSAFLDKAESIYNGMLSDDGKAIYMQAGIMASAITQNKYFKFCPPCFKEDLHQYGELYWYRQHQLPGKLVCLKHGVWLEESNVPITHSNKHSFILPTPSNCELTKGIPVADNLLEEYKQFLSQADVLLSSIFKSNSFSYLTDFYRKHLIEAGYATFNGQVHQKKLFDAFRGYYSDELLKNINVGVKSTESWLASITRKHRKSFHPYYHILFLNFLGLSVNDVFQETSLEVESCGKPKWPCLNIVCLSYKGDVIEEVTIRTCEKTKQPIGRFTCKKCGFSYTRKGKGQTVEDRFKITRIMNFGSLWMKELSNLLIEGLSYREIARRLNVDPNTVIKYAKTEAAESKAIEVQNIDKADLVESNRKSWLLLQQDNPNLSKTELRKQNPATYAFLYRNDREWLHDNSPTLRKKIAENKRVNWEKRDQEILANVKKATRELRARNGKLKRITVKSIGDAIGERALLEQHLDKMPKTKVFINAVKESDQEFRLRRVQHVINEMREAGEVIKTWKVLRKAGIKKQFFNEIKELIDMHLEK